MPEPPKTKMLLLEGCTLYDAAPDEDIALSNTGFVSQDIEIHSISNRGRLVTRLSKIILN